MKIRTLTIAGCMIALSSAGATLAYGQGATDQAGMERGSEGAAATWGENENGLNGFDAARSEGGMDRGDGDRAGMDHGDMDRAGMDRAGMDHGDMDHGDMDHGDMDRMARRDNMGRGAKAEGAGRGMRRQERFCSMEKLPDGQRIAERLTGHLDLRDAQKPALKDLRETFAKTLADAQKSLCGNKPDMSTVVGRLALVAKVADTKLQGLKTVEPKLEAFYNVLDDKQKAAFNEMKLWHHHHHHRHHGDEGDYGRGNE